MLRPWFPKLGRAEEVPEYVTDELLLMEGSGAYSIRGWLASRKKEMNVLVEIDQALATVLPTDIWYLDSVKLRADWRIKVTTPDFQPRLAREATQLIDNAIAIYQDPEFYSMRLASSYVAGDVLDSVETARRLIHLFESEVEEAEYGTITPDSRAIKVKLRQVSAAQVVLDDLQGDKRIPEYKLRL